jgi:hypothetical protein
MHAVALNRRLRCSGGGDRSACFTRSYASYIKGTGSILFDPKQGRKDGAAGALDAEQVEPAEGEAPDSLQAAAEEEEEEEVGIAIM